MTTLGRIFNIIILSLLINQSAKATIVLDSITTVNSSCINNGVVTFYAHSIPAGNLLFAVVAGPIVTPIQNSNTISSLYPGNYTARIYDTNFDSLETSFHIGGNYQLPNFRLDIENPTCSGMSDGSIMAVADSNLGLPPFIYQIIAPFSGAIGSQYYFPGLDANNYLIRMTDGCGNYQTRSATLSSTGTGLTAIPSPLFPFFDKTGCDTFAVSTYLYLYKEKGNLPLTLTYNTLSGSLSKQVYAQAIDTINFNPGIYSILDTLHNITYGDSCQLVLTDICGSSNSSLYGQIAPYEWELQFFASSVNCTATFSAQLQLKQIPYYPYHNILAASDISFVLTDLASGLIVDSMTCNHCNPNLHEEIPGNAYELVVTDGCGQLWKDTIIWPTQGPPQVVLYALNGCLDSTAVLQFEYSGFESLPTLTFFSGPVVAQSSKAHFNYSDSISYPRFFSSSLPGFIIIKDCPQGYYDFEIADSCGNSIQGNFTIEPYMVSDLKYSWVIKPSCLNNNTLYYNFNEGTPAAIYAQIAGIGNSYFKSINPPSTVLDSITNLNLGQYAVEIYYLIHNNSGIYYDGSLLNTEPNCWVANDTIIISPYTNSSFLTNISIYCNGTNYVQLIPDSSRGVPPYQFAIISGPQTFPLQDSAIFMIQQLGNYVVSMEDVCGNNYTQQISVTSDSFPPLIRVGFFCFGNNASLQAIASPYFDYIWIHPNGTQSTGNSISFSPFTPSDTGIYHILKIVNINGCSDTLDTYYHLQNGDSIRHSITLCYGDTLIVGNNSYTQSGIYINSFTSVNGCDSIIITTLEIIPLPEDTVEVTICKGDSVVVGNHIYFQSGIFTDTIISQTPCMLKRTTKITVDFFEINTTFRICMGDTLFIGPFQHFVEGFYDDTLKNYLGCDSIIHVNLQFYQKPLYPIITAIDTVLFNDSILLTSSLPDAIKFQWYGQAAFTYSDSSQSYAILQTTSWIYLAVTDLYGCIYIDSILIRVVENDLCDDQFWGRLPNVFTPNNDGLNDLFEFAKYENYLLRISIYNRWGKLIFQSDEQKKWDGRDNSNKYCEDGVYFYLLEYIDCAEHRQKTIQGSINLIR
jgi:gliding motility-associated-like protein